MSPILSPIRSPWELLSACLCGCLFFLTGDAVYLHQQPWGQRGIHSIYKVTYLYRMDYICKNKNLKTTAQREPHPPPPMTPACGNARRVAPGHAGGSDAWKEKPPAMEISTEPPTHRHMIGYRVDT